MRDTPYATELKTVEDAIGQRIERLHVKEYNREEIRFSWWKNGQLVIRPLDLPEDELLALMSAAVDKGVFSDQFVAGLQSMLVSHIGKNGCEQTLQLSRDAKSTGSVRVGEKESLIEYLRRAEPINEPWPDINDPLPEPVNI